MVSFDFYRDTYQGSSISDEEWPMFCQRAHDQLNRYKRAYTVTAPDENSESMAVCAMAEALAYFTAAQNGMGAVASASIGSVSVSYGNSATSVDLSPKAQAKELYRCATQYLEIYRGVGGC
jgi:hypothetical protein